MGLLDKLKAGISRFGYSGIRPETWPGDLKNSPLHNQYSLNGEPNVKANGSPSKLDLNGKAPIKYTENLPK